MKTVIYQDKIFTYPVHNITIPIFSDRNKHYAINDVIALSVYDFDADTLYFLPQSHPETIQASQIRVSLATIHAPNVKHVHHAFKMLKITDFNECSGIDLSLARLWYKGKIYNEEEYYSLFQKKLYQTIAMDKIVNLNKSIPLVKLVEFAESFTRAMVEEYNELMNMVNGEFYLYDNLLSVLSAIESNGLRVDDTISNHDGFVYTEYNVYTPTGRPSNAFGGINFAALNKHDGSRTAFISRFPEGKLINIDYESHHLHLIAELIGHKFYEPAHEYFAKLYFNKTDISQDEYEESKRITFKYLYGPQDPQAPEFFQEVYAFINKLDREIRASGRCTVHFPRNNWRKTYYLADFDNYRASKLFNYMIQYYEAVSVMTDIDRIMGRITGRMKVILYTYDSILLDIPKDENVEGLLDLFYHPIRIYKGSNYNEMERVVL